MKGINNMKINDVKDKINASYNTIRKFILSTPEYHEKVENVLHVTDLGYEKLIEVYGIKAGLLSDDSVDFYKIQLKLLHDQLQESREYNQLFRIQIENKDSKVEDLSRELKELEKSLREKELELIKANHELELEKNKSFFRKLFNK